MATERKQQDIMLLDEAANLKDYNEAVLNADWNDVDKYFTWYKTGKVNMVYEAIDRHVAEGNGNKKALIFTDSVRDVEYTYAELQKLSCQFANGLKTLGITKGDRVFIFMPRGPELLIALLGIVRIGAIAGPLFEAFMEEAIKDRLQDSGAVAVVIHSSLLYRLKTDTLPALKHVIVADAEEKTADNQVLFNDLLNVSDEYTIKWVNREDGMMLHYTSGSTGKPKGVLQVHDAMRHQLIAGKWVYDFHEGDVYWCTADPGWITGTSAGIWSPFLNGVTIVIRGGRFNPADWYATLEKYKVNVWYSAPTAFRMLMGEGDQLPKQYDFSNLRHIMSVGEPLNSEVIRWGLDILNRRIHDTWWMTETGSVICANYRTVPIRPGSMGKPLPFINLSIINEEGIEVGPNIKGSLAIKAPWPAMMRKIWNNNGKYQEYFLNGWFVTGDSAYKDEDGYFWFEGRVDDVINTSGERVGPFEVESKLIEHPAVAEAGVIGVPDPLRGEVIKAFISLRTGYKESEELKEEIRLFVKERLAAHSAPRIIEFIDTLPKTRSGKIMRRVLKAWELGLSTGDISTMEDDSH